MDVALLPAWYLTESRWVAVVREFLEPRQLVAMHLAEEGAPANYFGSAENRVQRSEQIRKNFPGVTILEPNRTKLFLPASVEKPEKNL